MKLKYSQKIIEIHTEISIFINIHLVAVELFHTDRRTDGRTDKETDMTKLIVAFRNFAKAPRNYKII